MAVAHVDGSCDAKAIAETMSNGTIVRRKSMLLSLVLQSNVKLATQNKFNVGSTRIVYDDGIGHKA